MERKSITDTLHMGDSKIIFDVDTTNNLLFTVDI